MRGLIWKGTGLVAAVTLALAADASAATFAPTRTDDPNPGQCRPNDCSLREAARAAVIDPGNDRIVLGARTYEFEQPETGDGDGLSGDLDLFNSGVIELVGRGPGKTTIDAAGLDRVMEVFEGGRVGVRDLTLTGGVAAEPVQSGGAISNEGRLTLQHVVVRDNEAEDGGGGLHNELGANATVISSTFRANDTGEFGDGGAIDNRNEARITITGSKFLGNTASSDGGGLSNQNEGVMNLRRSTVSGNSNPLASGGRAGGILNQNDAELTVVDSTISGNETETIGGGMFIQNNSVVRFKNSTISGNEAGEDGGGVFLNNWPTVSFSFTTIANNTATSVGGAIQDETSTPGMSTPQPPFLSFRASIVAANSATIGANCSVGQADVWETMGSNVEDGDDSCLFGLGSDQPNGDAMLRPLARNGGSTKTHAVRAQSDAVDAAPKKSCPKRDQRGVARPQGPRCDGGSYELQ